MSARAHEEIAKRAYAIWEAEARADGRHVEHWLRAEAVWLAERRRGPRILVRSKPIRVERTAGSAVSALAPAGRGRGPAKRGG